jgi:hypothetical protein
LLGGRRIVKRDGLENRNWKMEKREEIKITQRRGERREEGKSRPSLRPAKSAGLRSG